MSSEKYWEKELAKEKLKKKTSVDKIVKDMEKKKLKFDLQNLKELVEQWVVDKSLFESIKKDSILSNDEFQDVVESVDMKEVFEKLNEIENFEDIDSIVPKELRVSKNEYMQALKDPEKKKDVLAKFDKSLDIVANNFRWVSPFKRSIFTSYVWLLSKNMIDLQWKIIDIKRTLTS